MTDTYEVKAPGADRQPRSVLMAIAIVAITLSLFQLYAAGIQPLGLFFQRPIHLGFILVLCFLMYPVTGNRPRGLVGCRGTWFSHRRKVCDGSRNSSCGA